MSWSSRPRAWGLALVLAANPQVLAAQVRHEWQVMGVALASRPAVGVVGIGANWRDRGRTRIGLSVAGGKTDDDRGAARAELVWHFSLDPARRRGWGVYGGGGLAVGVIEQDHVRPWVQAVIGVESRPGGSGGFFVEGGFGGGGRLAAGWRWRKQNAPGR
jgi:hypothetical protein